MKKGKSSRRWLDRHVNDAYVKRARKDGYRSRAAYKLMEIQERDHLLKPGMRVVDLGAAPGGWSQVAAHQVGKTGRVVATDILPMEPIVGVDFLLGDFREQHVLDALGGVLGTAAVDLVLSDMAPNVSGMKAVDQPRAMYLSELALDLASRILRPGGAFVVKVFHGEGFDDYMRQMKAVFGRAVSRKPKSSRPESREVYIVATGYKAVQS